MIEKIGIQVRVYSQDKEKVLLEERKKQASTRGEDSGDL